MSGIRYIQFALNRVRAKKFQGDPFVTLKKSPRNVISDMRYIWNALYLVCVKSGKGYYCLRGLVYSSTVVCRLSKGTLPNLR